MLLILITLLLALSEVPAAGASVTIEGGADATGQIYTWRVTNTSSQGITQIEFPHYRATLFFSPPGWTHECTNLVAVGVKKQGGNCVAKAEPPLARGRSAEFRMQLAASGARRTNGAILVRFNDGHVEAVPAQVPGPDPLGERYLALIGLGTIFAVAVLIQWARARSKRSASQTN